MKSNEVNQNQEKKWPKVVLILVVGLAAFSSAMKELNQVHALATEAGALIADWVGVVEPTVNARSIATVENCSAASPGSPLGVVVPGALGDGTAVHLRMRADLTNFTGADALRRAQRWRLRGSMGT